MAGSSPRTQRFWSLDILRGVCSLAVFANHWLLWSDFAPQGAIETGIHGFVDKAYEGFVALAWPVGGQHPAVICFFVLSGFCVHYPFEAAREKSISWRDYFVRRMRRILPVYWVGSTLGLVFVGAMYGQTVSDPFLTLHAGASIAQVAARFGLFSALWPHEVFVGNYTLNTVGVEVLIYFLYPLFFRQTEAGRWWRLGLLAIAAQVAALALRPYVDAYVLFSSILVMALFWYVGALMAHLYLQFQWRVRGWWVGATWALFLMMKLLPAFYGRNMLRQAVWGVICGLVIGWLISWEGNNQSKRETPLARLFLWFGDVSYSLYAVHTPVILIVNWLFFLTTNARPYLWQVAINLTASMLTTVMVHRFIETRFYRPKKTSASVALPAQQMPQGG